MHCTSAHSVSSWTCPAVVSLLSGLYPHRHGGGVVPGEPKNLSKHNLPTKAPPDLPLLPDLLAERGYATAAFGAVWNAHLPVPERFTEMVMMEKPAPKLVDRSLSWMRARAGEDRPFFLWLHLGDTHEPLDVRKDLRDVFGPIPRIKKLREWDYTKSSDAVGTEDFRKYRDARILLYDAATRSVDASLEDLWKSMESLGINERTVWVVTADHGEEFWEHRDEELASFTDPATCTAPGTVTTCSRCTCSFRLSRSGPVSPRAPSSGTLASSMCSRPYWPRWAWTDRRSTAARCSKQATREPIARSSPKPSPTGSRSAP